MPSFTEQTRAALALARSLKNTKPGIGVPLDKKNPNWKLTIDYKKELSATDLEAVNLYLTLEQSDKLNEEWVAQQA